jgi:exodeoxyribonuclease V alpha subunit
MERVRAGVLHAMARAADDGHVFLPRARLLELAATLLGVDPELVARGVGELVAAGTLVAQPLAGGGGPGLYTPELYQAESGVAADIERLLGARVELPPLRIERAIDWFEERQGFAFASQQRRAIESGLRERITIITGGPGTGKTTLVRAITEILSRKGQRILLAAPTGRAANRLSEATGLAARTIHRLLEFDAHRHAFQRGPGRPLEVDVLIVDEVSMLDCALTHLLLAAMPSGGRLVLLGDGDQLPSVGPGRVLDDLIASGRVPVVPLTEIFRQAAASRIVRSAHLVNRGEMPPLEPPPAASGASGSRRSDFFFIERDEPEAILETLLHLVTERIPASFGLDPLEDIQVLTPMRRGLLGTIHLNRELQARLNPRRQQVQRGGLSLGIGDRVM